MISLISKLFFSKCFFMCNQLLQRWLSHSSIPKHQQLSKKLSRNATCLSHTLLSILISGFYIFFPHSDIYFLMTTLSSGYFIFDTYYLLKYDQKSLKNILFIYHHCVSLYILTKGPEYLIDKFLFWAEISNAPYYFVYYYLKVDPESSNLQLWKQIQKYIYVLIRVPILGYYSYQNYFFLEEKIPYYICAPLYFLGIVSSIHFFIN